MTVITDNSKVNYNLIKENEKLKERIEWLEQKLLLHNVSKKQTELIDKLLHLGSTIEICNSTQTSEKAKELAHKLLDEYLEAINYTHCCKSDSELLLGFLDVLEKLPRVQIPYDMKMYAIKQYQKANCG